MRFIFSITVLLFYCFTVLHSAAAAGIQASPPNLVIELSSGKDATAEVVIANPTPSTQIFTANFDNDPDFLTVFPESFTIEPGLRKTLTITAKDARSLDDFNVQNYTLSVIAKPLSQDEFQAETGVKIPTEVRLKQSQLPDTVKNFLFAGATGIVLILAYFLISKSMNRKPKT